MSNGYRPEACRHDGVLFAYSFNSRPLHFKDFLCALCVSVVKYFLLLSLSVAGICLIEKLLPTKMGYALNIKQAFRIYRGLLRYVFQRLCSQF